MTAIDLISKGETLKAIDVLLKEATATKDKAINKSLVLLKSNLKRSKREHLMGLITREEYQVVIAKTNQYLLEYDKEGKLEVAPKAVQGKLKSFIKYPLLVLSGCAFFYAAILFYLRSDIIRELLLYQNFDIDSYKLIMPLLLLVGSLYLFLKTKNHA